MKLQQQIDPHPAGARLEAPHHVVVAVLLRFAHIAGVDVLQGVKASVLELGPVNTDFAGCVGDPKGLAPGANRSWVGNPARIGNAAIGLLGRRA